MAPTDPHHDQSPTRSTHFVPYSPTNKTQNYPPQHYQPPPRTPPAFAAAPVSRSPQFGLHAAASSPSLMNGNGPHPSDQAQAYPVTYTPPRPSNGPPYGESPMLNGHHPYNSNSGSHAHPAKTRSDLSPISPNHSLGTNNIQRVEMVNSSEAIQGPQPPEPQPEPKPARTNNPMSFASILSEPAVTEPAVEVKPTITKPVTPQKPDPPAKTEVKQEYNEKSAPLSPISQVKPIPLSNGHSIPLQSIETPSLENVKPRKHLTASENERIVKALETAEYEIAIDLDDSGFGADKERYLEKRQKRAAEDQEQEDSKRKRRRTHVVDQSLRSFAARNSGASDRFRAKFEPAAQNEVHEKEVREEKERKKDMQRKRRRENTVKQEKRKLAETQEKFENAEDAEEKERLEREVERFRKKIELAEKRETEGGATAKELSEVAPLAPNHDGGTTSTLQLGAKDPDTDKKKPKAGPSTRPKKSKEKKQAQKDAAEAAYAAMERDELVQIAPKQESRKETLKRGSKSGRVKEETPTRAGANYESKGYQQISEQIWRDIARKDAPRVHRIKVNSLNTRQENHRKTSQLAHKQARKWQERTNKSMKETQARSKRTMREMMSFWKRNEREERDLRRVAERKEIEDAKKAEADREANRQKRKLNFLISQTELYSHFIGRKIKTDEVERATDDPEIAKAQPTEGKSQDLNIDSSMLDSKQGVTNFEDLDFDADDDAALRQAAVANAQNAVQEAQDKARAFNKDGDESVAFDDNDADLNFQNPTSLGDRQIEQPKMLHATLKEYQLKGLNWLTNLYEQGINGILADEMGLGKTVQSISVMGYLAEQHDIWGPFLVIAPSSTLHNWQQEIDRFVPDIKVLPYWGNAKDRKVLRKCWDRKHVTYAKDAQFHVLVTSYQLVVQDAQYLQKIKWQYMILDEAQAIKSSNSSRWKTLLGFECRNRLLLTGTPIQNNMQELWALLHFIMPTLFDSHDEFSDWFSKDIESHAQSNTRLNHDQLKRLHLILKPFMLRRVKAHVQKELGDKIEEDVYCNLTYRQRAYYGNLRSRISILDLIEKATVGDDQDTATLMNLVMQFRKVCNHPDLFERADTKSPLSLTHYAETASFLREGREVQLGYSVRNIIEYDLPKMLCTPTGRINVAGPDNVQAGTRFRVLNHLANIWDPSYLKQSSLKGGAFSFLRFIDTSYSEAVHSSRAELFDRAVRLKEKNNASQARFSVFEDGDAHSPRSSMFNIVQSNRIPLAEIPADSHLGNLLDISRQVYREQGFATMEAAALPGASAPPIQISCPNQDPINERQLSLFNVSARRALFPIPDQVERAVVDENVDPSFLPGCNMLPEPDSSNGRFTNITVPSMRRFVTDSGKLAKLDQLLRQLKAGNHRVLLYFQMTRMIDLMEEYLTYCNYKYCRLDGSTKLEDRRDTVHDFQTRPEIFVFLLSTRAGGLGINLTAADTVIFYDSDWNPTIDSQAMDRAHRLGQTRQVTVYRMITRGTIEERIRKRALQKEEVQRVVISGEGGEGVDFNTRTRENRTKDIAMWLADDDQAALIEQKEKEAAERPEEEVKRKKVKKPAVPGKRKRGEMSLDDMYHEGEGHFEDASAKPSGAATPVSVADLPASSKGPRGGRGSKKAKTKEQRLQLVGGDTEMSGM